MNTHICMHKYIRMYTKFINNLIHIRRSIYIYIYREREREREGEEDREITRVSLWLPSNLGLNRIDYAIWGVLEHKTNANSRPKYWFA